MLTCMILGGLASMRNVVDEVLVPRNPVINVEALHTIEAFPIQSRASTGAENKPLFPIRYRPNLASPPFRELQETRQLAAILLTHALFFAS